MSRSLNPSIIPLFKKKAFLASLSEDDFRDTVVRPFYLLMGLTHGKDLCGPDEEGKDCYFFGEDKVRGRILYVVQTKKGDLKMSAKARDNVVTAQTQLQMALKTPVRDGVHKYYPDCVVLAASGEINKKAQDHITEEISDTRVVFRDVNYFVPLIDKLMPELWYGIDVKRLPYLKALREHLLAQSETIDISQVSGGSLTHAPITSDSFIQLYLHRYGTKPKRHRGKVTDTLHVEEFPIQNILQRRERLLLITGEAGAGKTTSLRRLAMIMIEESLQSKEAKGIPIYLKAAEIVTSDKKLVECAAEITKALTPEDAPAFCRDDLSSGHVTLFIDGLDEVACESSETLLFGRIAEFSQNFPTCQVIVTSRDYPCVARFIQALPTHRFHVSPISFQQAGRMIERLSKGQSLSQDLTQEMLRRLENVHGLELNPLLVTVFVATTDYSRTDIPANITELFKKFTEMMLGRWDQSKGLSQQYQSHLKDFLLCRIAFKMHTDKSTTMPLAECRALIDRELRERGHEADMDILFDEIVYRSGLVRVDDSEVSFRHLLLQEFFAGRAIPSVEFLGSVVTDEWWAKAIVFYFGENPDDHSGLAALRQGIDTVIGADLFQAAITVGLAVQACYLMKVTDKAEALRWVVEMISCPKNECLENFVSTNKGAHTIAVLFYYLYGRDAVASKVIGQVTSQILADTNSAEEENEGHDTRLFWCIAGLLESQQLERAEELIKGFRPTDQRLLLALHLGSFYVQQLHVTSAAQKKIAKRICDHLHPQIEHLIPSVTKELKGMLLEVQQGQVRALDASTT